MDHSDIHGSGVTHVGKVRTANEDSWIAEHPVYAVSDGMGGHSRGAAASQAVVAALKELVGTTEATPADVADALACARQSVEELCVPRQPKSPGATVSGVVYTTNAHLPCWIVFDVGDSRTYRLQAGSMQQITVDHSACEEYRALPAEEQSKRIMPQSNIITRVIGAGGHVRQDADMWVLAAEPGERMLICSDGLCRHVDDITIQHILTTTAKPEDAAQALLDLAMAGGGQDNISVVVVDSQPTDAELVSGTTQQSTDTVETYFDDQDPEPIPVNVDSSCGEEVTASPTTGGAE